MYRRPIEMTHPSFFLFWVWGGDGDYFYGKLYIFVALSRSHARTS